MTKKGDGDFPLLTGDAEKSTSTAREEGKLML